ncbi:hypothetical protein CA54_35230 [Symmachiella macrocystis]|uniref:Uncharacterized protein n=1 Tax=Symmachiella macrocystis TaxID=2527985 RepID=A0A5C6BVD7_9PLAN|nr:hypothetical protein [Symmachiella macrocystis]TWU14654.1 hypothetical protein CA54_35230 [Symmachiella macrocystis]
MMKSTFEKIELDSSRFWCLHVADEAERQALSGEIFHHYKLERVSCIIAQPASLDSVRRRLFRQPTVIEWLTQNADISADDAAAIIGGLPVHVLPLLSYNAGNPRAFLGLAAAIAKKPDVIVYSTSGMDLCGILLMHNYAPAHYPDGCLIHVSPQLIGDGPHCANDAQCVTIQFRGQTS